MKEGMMKTVNYQNHSGGPTLTKNYAGIGSRNLTPEALKAITDVYTKTLENENNTING